MPVFAMQPFERGVRLSVLASLDVTGFLSWTCTKGTYTRKSFHQAFVNDILPKLARWPGPRSIVVLDNASIHMYPELSAACALVHVKLLYLPPYTPQLNPIECGFNIMKSWLARHCTASLWKLNAEYCHRDSIHVLYELFQCGSRHACLLRLRSEWHSDATHLTTHVPSCDNKISLDAWPTWCEAYRKHI